MELEQLRIFAAAARSLSLSGAARQLYISHSTVSRAVAALEGELGVCLLRRRGNRVLALTAAGETLLAEAEGLLAAAERAAARTRAAEAIEIKDDFL